MYQDLIFPAGTTDDAFMGIIVEADNLVEIREEIIAGLTLTPFDGAITNPTKTAAELTISAYGAGTQFVLEYTETNAFDRLQLKLSPSALPAAVNAIRVYNNYYYVAVEFISISAKPGNNDITLQWSTALEINNDYFVVQRSRGIKSLWMLLN